MNDNAKVKFYIDKTGFFAESAMILFLLSAIFRVIGCWGLWNNRVDFIMLLLLPACCCLLLTVCILVFGKKGFFFSFIPVLLGMVFFVFTSFGEDWFYTVLYVLLELVIAVAYTGTVFGWIRTKWLLPPLFALPFLYRLIVVDIPALSNTAEPVSFAAGMQEMSVLFILAAMFCVSMGLKKKVRESAVKPAPAPAQPETAAPAPAQPEAAASAPAAESAPEDNPILTEPYTPMLTLEPEPIGPEAAGEEKPNEDEHE